MYLMMCGHEESAIDVLGNPLCLVCPKSNPRRYLIRLSAYQGLGPAGRANIDHRWRELVGAQRPARNFEEDWVVAQEQIEARFPVVPIPAPVWPGPPEGA